MMFIQLLNRRYAWLVCAVVVAGAGARVALIFSPSFTLDADKAVVYLMAVQQSRGTFSALFWGQSYGGTPISVVAGALMWLTATRSSCFVLGVTLVTTLFAALTLWRFTVLSAGRAAGFAALVLFLFPGAYLLRQSVDDGGFYASSLLFALAALWLAIDDAATRRLPRLVRAAFVGLAAGVALWCSPMGFALAAPALVLVARRRPRLATLSIAACAVPLGAAPYLLMSVFPPATGGFQTHSLSPTATVTLSLSDLHERVRSLAFELLPAGLPLGHTGHTGLPGLPGLAGLADAVVVGAAALALVLLWRVARDRTGASFGIALGGALVSALLLVSGNPLDQSAARYDEFLLPALCFAAGSALTLLGRRPRVILAGAVPLIATVVTVSVLAAGMPVTQVSPNQLVASTDAPSLSSSARFGHDAMLLSHYLESAHVTAIWATYWLSYRIAAASDGDIVATDIEYDRYPPARAIAAANRAVIVVVSGSRDESALAAPNAAVTPSEQAQVGGASIFFYDHPLTEGQVLSLVPSGRQTP